MPKKSSAKKAVLVRTFTFGIEDSLVSTAGLVTGIAAGGIPRNEIVLAGIVLIFVEAFSMGVGSYLSERSSEEYQKRQTISAGKTLPMAIVMFVSYFIAGIIPLFPYGIFSIPLAVGVSILLTLIALYGLGVLTGRLAGLKVWREGWEMMSIGGLAIIIGVIVGWIMKR